MSCYGFEIQFERPEECKVRYQGHGTFIDLWDSRKGLTAGVYDRKRSSMSFQKRLTPVRLEEILIRIEKEAGD